MFGVLRNLLSILFLLSLLPPLPLLLPLLLLLGKDYPLKQSQLDLPIQVGHLHIGEFLEYPIPHHRMIDELLLSHPLESILVIGALLLL